MIAAVRAAVEARLVEFNARPTTPENPPGYPYTVFYVSSGPFRSVSLADERTLRDFDINTIVVGLDADQCAQLTERVMQAFRHWRPEFVDAVSWKVRSLASQPARRDDDLPNEVLFIATDQWRLSLVDY